MAENTESGTGLKAILKDYGNYQFKGNFILLYDNAFLADKDFMQTCVTHGVKIQLDLFTPIPNTK